MIVAQIRLNEVRAVPVTEVTPVALLHGTDTGVSPAALVPKGPCVTPVLHSVNLSCVM